MSVLVGPDRPQYNISDSQSDVKITVRSHRISLAGSGLAPAHCSLQGRKFLSQKCLIFVTSDICGRTELKLKILQFQFELVHSWDLSCDWFVRVQVLLLQCQQSEDRVAQARRVRHHPPGQAPDTEAEHGAPGGAREGQAADQRQSDQRQLQTEAGPARAGRSGGEEQWSPDHTESPGAQERRQVPGSLQHGRHQPRSDQAEPQEVPASPRLRTPEDQRRPTQWQEVAGRSQARLQQQRGH